MEDLPITEYRELIPHAFNIANLLAGNEYLPIVNPKERSKAILSDLETYERRFHELNKGFKK